MRTRRIGDWDVGAIGLGAAGLSVADPPAEADAVETIAAALDAGVSLIDTAACYVPHHEAQGHNEALIAKAVAGWAGDRDRVLVASKGGIRRIRTEAFEVDYLTDARPDAIRRDCDDSLAALGAHPIGLYQLHAPDPAVPFEETVGALRDLKQAGKVRMVGLCNVSIEQIEAARVIVEIASVQNRF